MTLLTVYPNANPESVSVDGWVARTGTNEAWATLKPGAGNQSNDSEVNSYIIIGSAASPNWNDLRRAIFLFDTSSIPDDAIVDSAVLSIYGSGKADDCAISPEYKIFGSTPASNTALVNADFAQTQNTPLCDTAITYASWNTGGYNAFNLNAAGLAAISKTGISKFSLRESKYDAGSTTPTHPGSAKQTYIYFNTADGTNKPKLDITYHLPGDNHPLFFRGGAVIG